MRASVHFVPGVRGCGQFCFYNFPNWNARHLPLLLVVLLRVLYPCCLIHLCGSCILPHQVRLPSVRELANNQLLLVVHY